MIEYIPPGTKVHDDLTRKISTIVGVTFYDGVVPNRPNVTHAKVTGYWLDNDYLGGGRHPWEITEL